MSPLIVEKFQFFTKSLIKCRLRHLLKAASYKDSTISGDIANIIETRSESVYVPTMKEVNYILIYPFAGIEPGYLQEHILMEGGGENISEQDTIRDNPGHFKGGS